mgnify:CR=1 FL=1
MYKVIDLARTQGRVLFFLIIIFLGALVTDMYNCRTIATAAEDGLVGYWNFDKIEDGMVEDSSGNGNHGLVMGEVELVDGICGNGLKFDGSTTYVRIPMNSSLQSRDAITIEVCIYPTPPHQEEYGGIINNINGYGADAKSRLLVRDSGTLWVQYYGCYGSKGTFIGPNVINGAWNHVVYVYDGTEEVFYLNGQKRTSSPYSELLPIGDSPLIIGWGHGRTYHFNGIIDEVKIYNRALSQDEIEDIFKGDIVIQVPTYDEKLKRLYETYDLTLEHPRLRYTPEDIERARTLVKSGPSWAKQVYNDFKNKADAWLRRSDDFIRFYAPKPYSYYLSGSYGGVCPKCGQTLDPIGWSQPGKLRCSNGHVYPNGQAPDDGKGWRAPDGTVYYMVARWNAFVTTEYTEAIENLAYAYALSGDNRYAQKAAVILDALATIYPTAVEGPQDYPGLRPGKEGGRLDRPYSQVARHLIRYANAFDLILSSSVMDGESLTNPGLTMKDNIARNLLINGADYCFREASGPVYGSTLGNGTADYNTGILSVGSVLGIPEYVDWVLDSPVSIYNMLYNNIDRDGNYYETSAMYGEHTRGLYITTAEFLYNLRNSKYPKGINLYDDPQFRRLCIDPIFKNSIAGHLPLNGDAGPDTSVDRVGSLKMNETEFERTLMFYTRCSDEEKKREYAQALFNMAGGDPNKKISGLWSVFAINKIEGYDSSKASSMYRESEVLGGKGIALLRSGKSPHERGIFLRYGATLSHGHKDEMAIMIFAKGREFSFDPGYYNTHYRFGWTNQTVSHLTVAVNQRSQLALESPGGSLNLFTARNGFSLVDVSDESAYRSEGLDMYRRALALVDVSNQDSYIIDIFRVAGGQTRDYSFHAQGASFKVEGLNLSEPQKTGSLASPDYEWGTKLRGDYRIIGQEHRDFYWTPPGEGYGFLSGVQRGSGEDTWSATWSTFDGARLRMTMLGASNREVIVADGPKPMGVKYTLARDKREGSSQYVALIEPVEGAKFLVDSFEGLTIERTDEGKLSPVAVKVVLNPEAISPKSGTWDIKALLGLGSKSGGSGKTDYIFSTLGGKAFTAKSGDESFTTDGEYAFLRQDDKGIEHLILIKGHIFQSPEVNLTSQDREFTGQILSVDYENQSLLVDGSLPLGEVLKGEYILISNPLYSHNSPYKILKVGQEGSHYRIYLEDTSLLLAIGLVGRKPSGDVLPNTVALPYSKGLRGPGSNDYFKGKLVTNGVTSTRIKAVGGDFASLIVEENQGFALGDTLLIHDVQEGDEYTICVSFTMERSQDDPKEYKVQLMAPVTLTFPEAYITELTLIREDGSSLNLEAEKTGGNVSFYLNPQDVYGGKGTLKVK